MKFSLIINKKLISSGSWCRWERDMDQSPWRHHSQACSCYD